MKLTKKSSENEAVDALDLMDNKTATLKKKTASKLKRTPAKKMIRPERKKPDPAVPSASKISKPDKKKRGKSLSLLPNDVAFNLKLMFIRFFHNKI